MTNEPKFTPGPWHCGDFYDDYAIRGAKCNRIITRPNCNFDDASANAALIAQCPSLYANEERNLIALKKLLAYYENIDLNRHSEDCRMVANGIMSDLKDLIETTEQLLAKARGEVESDE